MLYSRGSEMKLNKFKNLNVSFGSINKNKPTSIYVVISGWLLPTEYDENINYSRIISHLNKNIRNFVYFNINPEMFKKEKTLVYLDIRESGLSNNKASFINCEITLNQINNYLLSSDILIKDLNELINKLILDIFLEDRHFQFFKKKKDALLKLKKPNHAD